MASLIKDPNGLKRIQFTDADGARKTVRLGRMTVRDAEAVKVKVERLVAAKASQCSWDSETAKWVADLPDSLAMKLAKQELIPPRRNTVREKLGAFLDSIVDRRVFGAENTRRNYEVTKKRLISHFGRDRFLKSINAGDANEWRESMQREELSPATIGREVKRARQFFREAVQHELISRNPFADVKAPAQVNTGRIHFVTRDVIKKVLDACPDAQWRLLVALSRYGGLRCPSEHLSLTWGDVNWADDRITIRSPKTSNHPGGESRVIPLFPELRPYLETVFEEAEPGTEHVITRYRLKNSNLRSQFVRIIERAGENVWPKVFHNLRASRETELTANHPLHVVCAWIGNSAAIAAKHYLQVTDDHFLAAIEGGAESGAQAAQNEAQQPDAGDGSESQTDDQASSEVEEEQELVLAGTTRSEDRQPDADCLAVPPRGVEPLSSD